MTEFWDVFTIIIDFMIINKCIKNVGILGLINRLTNEQTNMHNEVKDLREETKKAIFCLDNFYENLMKFEKFFKLEYYTDDSNIIRFYFRNHEEKNKITHILPDGDTRRFHTYCIFITFGEKNARFYYHMYRYVKGRCFTEKEWLHSGHRKMLH